MLRHDALVYHDENEYVGGLAPFLRDGLAEGDAIIAAVTPSHAQSLRDALGADAAAVRFVDRDEMYQRPATAISAWQDLLATAIERGHPRLRLVGEVVYGEPARHPTWIRYESAVNRLFADTPVWSVCPYDTRTMPEALVAGARRTHPSIRDPRRRRSDEYVLPEELLRAVPEPLPVVAGQPAVDITVHDQASVAAARRAVGDAVDGWPAEQRDGFLLAVSEVVANGLQHGRGGCQLRAWIGPSSLVCEVLDDGPGLADPFAGYARPAGELPENGWGLWLAHQTCDTVAIGRRDGRTLVRLAVTARP